MPLKIDPVLLSGSDEDLVEFASDTDRCVVVDWREEEGAIVDYVNDFLANDELSYEPDDSGEDLVLQYKGRELLMGLSGAPQDRYVALRAINRILAGDYEVRLIRVTYESDTHSFFVASAPWWRDAIDAHPRRMSEVFQTIDEGLDFP